MSAIRKALEDQIAQVKAMMQGNASSIPTMNDILQETYDNISILQNKSDGVNAALRELLDQMIAMRPEKVLADATATSRKRVEELKVVNLQAGNALETEEKRLETKQKERQEVTQELETMKALAPLMTGAITAPECVAYSLGRVTFVYPNKS